VHEIGGDRLERLARDVGRFGASRESLRALRALRAELADAERQRVAHALTAGSSLASIARDLGVPRQSLHRHYRYLIAPPLTAEAALVLEYAREESPAPGGAHVLVGVLRMPLLPATALLELAGVELAAIREVKVARPESLERLVTAAHRQAKQTEHEQVGVEHLLLAALQAKTGSARRALGVPAEPIEEALRRRVDPWLL
jgi:transposase-like protein